MSQKERLPACISNTILYLVSRNQYSAQIAWIRCWNLQDSFHYVSPSRWCFFVDLKFPSPVSSLWWVHQMLRISLSRNGWASNATIPAIRLVCCKDWRQQGLLSDPDLSCIPRDEILQDLARVRRVGVRDNFQRWPLISNPSRVLKNLLGSR